MSKNGARWLVANVFSMPSMLRSLLLKRCRFATRGIATDHHDLGARFDDLLGGDEPDATVGAGHYDDLVVHVNMVRSVSVVLTFGPHGVLLKLL